MGKFGVVKRSEPLTVEELRQKFPAKKNTITEETVALINEALDEPGFDDALFMTHLMDYQSCMIEAGAGMEEYIMAMKFCAYLEAEDSLTEAFKKARAKTKFVRERLNAPSDSVAYNELSSAASRYRKTKIVRQILTQSDMPLYLMFQGARYQAVALLAREMNTASLSKDRIAAADKLLLHVKPPENIQVELGVGPNKDAKEMMADLNAQIAGLVMNQRSMLEAGVDLSMAQKTGIKLGTYAEAELEE